MREFESSVWPPVLFGANKIFEAGKRFKAWNVSSVLVVYGEKLYKTGLVTPILDSLQAEGLKVTVFDKIEPEVPDYLVEKIAQAAIACEAGGILAVGGGSTIDAVKYASLYMYSDKKPMVDYLDIKPVFNFPQEGRVKVIFAPTTAGTGAEMTDRGPVFNTRISKKSLYINFPPMLADLAILDPCLTITMPPYLTYTTALDAMAHAMESMTSSVRNIRSEMLGAQAIEMIWNNLPKAMADGQDLEARSQLLVAANFAIAVESKRHIAHAFTEGLGSVFPINHGHCCVLALPETMRYLSDVGEIQRELKIIAQRMNLTVQSDYGQHIADELERLNKEYSIAGSLKELGIEYDEEKIKQCCDIIEADIPHLSKSVVPICRDDIERMMTKIYYGENLPK